MTCPSRLPRQIGDMVYFWTGRGSHGYATIRGFKDGRVLLDHEPDAVKGSDYRLREKLGRDWWLPRDRGLPLEHLDTPPNFWWKNF
ncbi:MAG TPA: hypothetical protein VGU24_13985 [Microvirga sp.]|nr:hypothetical protein [Microvirga sp.]